MDDYSVQLTRDNHSRDRIRVVGDFDYQEQVFEFVGWLTASAAFLPSRVRPEPYPAERQERTPYDASSGDRGDFSGESVSSDQLGGQRDHA